MIRLWPVVLAVSVCAAVSADELQLLEQRYGMNPVQITIGNGGLTLGFDEAGRICALNWPSPGYYAHIHYDPEAPATGIAWGLFRNNTIYWSNGSDWTRDESSIQKGHVVFSLTQPELAVSARVDATVAQNADRLDMRIEFEGTIDGDSVVWYSGLSPSTRVLPELAMAGGTIAPERGFACFANLSLNAAIHFRPSQPGISQWERAEQLASAETPPASWERFGSGSWFAISAGPTGQYRCADADEAMAALNSGRLPEGRLAATGSRAATVATAPIDSGTATFTLWAAASFDDLERAMTTRADAHDSEERDLFIDTIRVHQDRETGSVVRSVATTPPLNQDWPRLGAWSIRALDVAGETERATRLLDFYLRSLPNTELRPEGALPFALYPNGASAQLESLVDTDGAAWVVWAAVEHARGLAIAERSAFLDLRWDGLAQMAEFLVTWAEDTRGIPWHKYDSTLGHDRRDRSQIFTGHLAISSLITLARAEARPIPDSWIRREAQWAALMESYCQDPEFSFTSGEPVPFWAPELFPPDAPPVRAVLQARLQEIETGALTVASRYLAEIALYHASLTLNDPSLPAYDERLRQRVDPSRGGDALSDSYLASTAFVALNTGLRDGSGQP